ncbi:MAG: NUDIX hydrolase [Bacteroidota bacterium]
MDSRKLKRALTTPYSPKEFRELDLYVRKTAKEARQQIPMPRESAVLSIIHFRNQEAHLLVIKRPIYNGVHSGQMAFPGGKKEVSDISLKHTAIRETEEELGIAIPEDVKLFSLNELFIPPSQLLVQPFACIIEELPILSPNHEVAEIVHIPIKHILELETTVLHHIKAPDGNNFKPVKAISYEEYFIWGATAMMIFEIRERILNSFEPN